MLLGDFLKQYSARKKERQAFRNICKENNISYSKLPAFLKKLGYEYDRKAGGWIWNKYDHQPFDIDLYKALPMRAPVQHKQTSGDIEEAQKQIAAGKDTAQKQTDRTAEEKMQAQLLHDQLFDIVALLQQINIKMTVQPAQPKEAPEEDIEAAPLALQLHRINQSTKARKTINISEEAAGWLDNFAAMKGYKIGDLVTLAILQLKEKIDK